MRRRALTMTTVAVLIAVLLLGIPGMALGSLYILRSADDDVHRRATQIANVVDLNVMDQQAGDGHALPLDVMQATARGATYPMYVHVKMQDETRQVGTRPNGEVIEHTAAGRSGAQVTVGIAKSAVWRRIGLFIGLGIAAVATSFAVAVALARRQSRRISAPLIYLAAAAEQIGAGQASPRMKKSGIEEIDLVYEELVRTADRMAGRIAAERQFAADASHQLRTPLTALSMRLEEIEYLSEQEEVRQEAASCLEQVERLTGVVTDLLRSSRAVEASTEAVPLPKLFEQQADEWERSFAKAGRDLVFEDDAGVSVLAAPGALAQIVATLIENSLKYGKGATKVAARKVGKGVVIDVSDEGEGIREDLVDAIFNKGVSTGGSTGIGLPLARGLAEGAGGRLELAQAAPPIFRLTLNAVPKSINPQEILPAGAIVSVGARRRRR
jgi:putative two-component system histidine kinase